MAGSKDGTSAVYNPDPETLARWQMEGLAYTTPQELKDLKDEADRIRQDENGKDNERGLEKPEVPKLSYNASVGNEDTTPTFYGSNASPAEQETRDVDALNNQLRRIGGVVQNRADSGMQQVKQSQIGQFPKIETEGQRTRALERQLENAKKQFEELQKPQAKFNLQMAKRQFNELEKAKAAYQQYIDQAMMAYKHSKLVEIMTNPNIPLEMKPYIAALYGSQIPSFAQIITGAGVSAAANGNLNYKDLTPPQQPSSKQK